MRIAVVTATFLPNVGGAEFAVHHLANAWCAAGHAVCVFHWMDDAPPHPEARYTARRYPMLRGATRFGYHRVPWGAAQALVLSAMLHAWGPDLVSAHYGYPCGAWLASVRPRIPYVVTCHGAELNPEPWGLRARYHCEEALARGLAGSRAAVALSRDARAQMVSLGAPPERVVEIPNGVDAARYARPSRFDLRATLGLPKEARVVLSVARDHPTKNHDVTLAAHARVVRARRDVWQVFVGKGTDALVERARALGVGDRVVAHPGLYGDELVGAYQQADVFVLASRYEVSPLSLLEAMAAGRAVTVSRVSGCVDLVRDGVNGLTVPVGDAEALADAVGRLLDDAALREVMGERNRTVARAHDWSAVAARYLDAAAGRRVRPMISTEHTVGAG
ncbi:MAG: glycosyltransferase family 4 protein [Polyangiales bacterium]